jgi:ABC-2 type transport system ATP-binding protein
VEALDSQSGLPGAGHILLLTAQGEETYDLVRDVVADLGLGLVRMEQRRHHISEVFTNEDEQRKEAVSHGS